MKLLINIRCIFCFVSILFFWGYQNAIAAKDTRFECGGTVEEEVWTLWNTNVRDRLQQNLLQDRLLKQGDVYALYDFQTYTHNMVSMARRCNRTSRLMEFARLVRTAYGTLAPGTTLSCGRRWVCRGGAICNDKNRLLNQEVMLDSVQFLGLASSVANAVALSDVPLGEEDKAFIRETIQIATEHLLRWSDDSTIKELKRVTAVTPENVKNGSSEFFFTDKPLWMITIYAELAGILYANDHQNLGLHELSVENKAHLQKHLNVLLNFFAARISIQHDSNSRLGNVDLADLDRGYWRLYEDMRYAGYDKSEKPVLCVSSTADKTKVEMKVNVPTDKVQKRQDTGWDISHARRLVHALDALERNRDAMQKIWGIKQVQLPPSSLPNAFANTLIAVIWNGDTKKPLFSNWWSGANGWYRVAYDNGTGQCSEGDPPYGLTYSFPTGGYITWAKYRPEIGFLGLRLYDSINSPDDKSSIFVDKYYSPISKKNANTQARALQRFMFYPSLVGVNNK